MAYFQNGDLDRAIADHQQAIALHPEYYEAYEARGRVWIESEDYDRAISDYDQAIRLNPLAGSAYNSRGVAWRGKGDLDQAIADYSEALALGSRLSVVYNNRGIAWRAKGQLERALADYDTAIRLDTNFVVAYLNRGVANLYGGNLTKASADFRRATGVDPKDPYAALWLDLATRRLRGPRQLNKAVNNLNMRQWPAPIVRLYLGEITSSAVIASADSPRKEIRKGQQCEANFFAGALELLRSTKAQAMPFLQRAAQDCPRTFIEWEAANEEMRALETGR